MQRSTERRLSSMQQPFLITEQTVPGPAKSINNDIIIIEIMAASRNRVERLPIQGRRETQASAPHASKGGSKAWQRLVLFAVHCS